MRAVDFGVRPWLGVWLIMSLAPLLPGLAAAADEASGLPAVEDLVQRVAAAWDPVEVSMTAIMTLERRGRKPSTVELQIRRAGHGQTRIDFLAPVRDRGKVILEDDGETWLYLPRTGRVVEVPARRNPLAGGVLFEDLFLGGTGTTDATVEDHDDGFVLITDRGKIYFDRSTLLPIRREILSASGRLLKTVHIDATQEWQGEQIPSLIRVVDHLRHDAEARLEILEARELEGDLEALFSKDGLRPADSTEEP